MSIPIRRICYYFVAVVFGAGNGFFVAIVVGNFENFAFYSVRSWVTGRTAMSDIVRHAADGWIIPAIYGLLVVTGAAVAIIAARLLQASKPISMSAEEQESNTPSPS